MRIIDPKKIQASRIKRSQEQAMSPNWRSAQATEVNMNGYGNGQPAPMAVQPGQPINVDNRSDKVAFLENAVRTLATKMSSDVKTLASAVDGLMNAVNGLQQQNVALAKAFKAATAGIRVGYAPAPIVPSMPGQPIDVGIPTHAFRPQHAELVAGATGSPAVVDVTPDAGPGPSVTPAYGERLFYGDRSDEAFYSGGEED